MTFSLNKLIQILNKKKLIVNKIFSINNDCVYIELVNVKNGMVIFLYIPSKYIVKVPKEYRDMNYELSYYDINKELEINEQHFSVEEMYEKIDLKEDEASLEKNLLNNYNDKIFIKNSKVENHRILQSTNKQLERLGMMVKKLKYNLGIQFKNYFGCINRYNDIDFYEIDNIIAKDESNIFVIFDLEMLLSEDNICENCETIINKINEVLKRNLNKNMETFKTIMDTFSKTVNSNINQLNDYELIQLKGDLKHVSEDEEYIRNGINKLKEEKKQTRNFNNLELTKRIEKEYKKYEEITDERNNILEKIIQKNNSNFQKDLRNDRIFFDNSIMLSNILDNLKEMEKEHLD